MTAEVVGVGTEELTDESGDDAAGPLPHSGGAERRHREDRDAVHCVGMRDDRTFADV